MQQSLKAMLDAPADKTSQAEKVRLSRSPHPYHRRSISSTNPFDASNISTPVLGTPLRSTQNTDDERTNVTPVRQGSIAYTHSTDSDSGTEADDEHFLKGLPAPKHKGHKGLINGDGSRSDTPSPALSPDIVKDGERQLGATYKKAVLSAQRATNEEIWHARQKLGKKRIIELRRRACEVILLGVVGLVVFLSAEGRKSAAQWRHGKCTSSWQRGESLTFAGLKSELLILTTLTIIYPLRLMRYAVSNRSRGEWPFITIPPEFDPAPLLYPPTIPVLVAALLGAENSSSMIANIVLSISSLPAALIPSFLGFPSPDVHWFLSVLPYLWTKFVDRRGAARNNTCLPDYLAVYANPNAFSLQQRDAEVLFFLFPLHQSLCITLSCLTKTSLLAAEVQLLSIALINLLILSSSPQALILKALLWIGGVGTLVSCTRVLSYIVALARVPKWRFRRAETHTTVGSAALRGHLSSPVKWARLSMGHSTKIWADDSEDDDDVMDTSASRPLSFRSDATIHDHERSVRLVSSQGASTGAHFSRPVDINGNMVEASKRRTIPNTNPSRTSSKVTPSGRKRRSASVSSKRYFSLTESQASFRKWLYTGYVYTCIIGIIMIGIREYVSKYALNETEAIGWALGYLFGNLQAFRMYIVTSTYLSTWIRLPPQIASYKDSCAAGWVEHIRQSTIGPANTRLLLLAYWVIVIVFGISIVLRLSTVCAVDTRRKVFHFMMVAMLLPATFVDPLYAALALSLVLAVFLLLDLFRATQLPPLSKPLAMFLAPYVDGRDLRGPVVISHIFLLIGCAIPLWLSMGALPRTGDGWEVSTRDISMVSGVVCVGMGDAAASLIGRRFGRHKWFWPGGKSIEGSIAFAVAVGSALSVAKLWLILGGWTDGGDELSSKTFMRIASAAGIASFTEAVLTGGNDNVVVPVVLWLCVKALRI